MSTAESCRGEKMKEYDVTTYPEGYQKVIDQELSNIPEEERESFAFGLLRFMISC